MNRDEKRYFMRRIDDEYQVKSKKIGDTVIKELDKFSIADVDAQIEAVLSGNVSIDVAYLRERLMSRNSVYIDRLYRLGKHSIEYCNIRRDLEQSANIKRTKLEKDTQKLKDTIMLGSDEEALRMLNEYLSTEY